MSTMATDECLHFLTTIILTIIITLTNTSRKKVPPSIKGKASEPPDSAFTVGCSIMGSTYIFYKEHTSTIPELMSLTQLTMASSQPSVSPKLTPS